MDNEPDARRRSPRYVRKMTDRQVHQLCGRLMGKATRGPITLPQEWLLSACFSELEFRARRDLRAGITPCSCAWCSLRSEC
jgi:hypothetical protein